MIDIEYEKVDRQCGECGKTYQTAKSPFSGEPFSHKCFECKLLSRLDAVLYHFGIE